MSAFTPSSLRGVAAGVLIAIGALPASAAPPPATTTETAVSSHVPNLKQPGDRLLTGGQPDAEAWAKLAADGVTTVINLRPAAELGERDEAAEVTAAGMGYVQIPVAGAADITPENARALWTAMQQAPGKVLVHCASGNRVGALLALGAAEHGMSPEQALQYGRAAGLTGAEPRVREVLELPAK